MGMVTVVSSLEVMEEFLTKIGRFSRFIKLVIIDEAHCVATWCVVASMKSI